MASGFVDVGSPVAGATVVALDWSGRRRGASIATATSAEDGSFTLPLDDVERDSVLVVVTGGSFLDVATGLTVPLASGHELTVPVGRLAAGEARQANVNAWTTLAAARAKHTPDTDDDGFATSAPAGSYEANAYGIFELLMGHWGDRIGSRAVLTRIAVCWSFFTALTGTCTGLYSLLLVRFLFGIGEAGALPNFARVVSQWFPTGERGRVSEPA